MALRFTVTCSTDWASQVLLNTTDLWGEVLNHFQFWIPWRNATVNNEYLLQEKHISHIHVQSAYDFSSFTDSWGPSMDLLSGPWIPSQECTSRMKYLPVLWPVVHHVPTLVLSFFICKMRNHEMKVERVRNTTLWVVWHRCFTYHQSSTFLVGRMIPIWKTGKQEIWPDIHTSRWRS